MLFSHRDVASDVERLYEPVWIPLRPVPQVTIDFGDGNVVRRTLHGNIATWICDAEGRALDVIPGIYTTTAYRERLAQGALLAKFASVAGDRDARLRRYHAGQAERMDKAMAPLRLVERLRPLAAVSKFRIEQPLEVVFEELVTYTYSSVGGSAAAEMRAGGLGAKGGIERPVERTLLPGERPAPAAPYVSAKAGIERPVERTVAPDTEHVSAAPDFNAKVAVERPLEDAIDVDVAKREAEAGPRGATRPVANDSLLGDDVRVNETARRLEVHRLLAETGPVPFDTLTKRLYREVLHCDLDDPWLGLGPLLFGSYPFER